MSSKTETVVTGKTADTSWKAKGNCAGVDPNIFVPDSESPDYKAVIKEAKEVCSGCSQSGPCLEYGRTTQSEGVWGGVVLKTYKRSGGKRVNKLALPEFGPQVVDGLFNLTLYSNGQGLHGKPVPLVARRILYVLDSTPEPIMTDELMAGVYGVSGKELHPSDYHKVLIYEGRLGRRLSAWASTMPEQAASLPAIIKTRLPVRWGTLQHELVGLRCNFVPLDHDDGLNVFTPDGFVPTKPSDEIVPENGTVYDSRLVSVG